MAPWPPKVKGSLVEMTDEPLARIRENDPSGLLDDVLSLGDHLRDALWRISSAGLEEREAPMALVCGVGGSGVGGDLAAAAYGDRLTKPLIPVRGYEIPSWAPTDSLVCCSSYSGETEETLACYAAAEALGAPRIAATTGGALADAARADDVPVIGLPGILQPRAAVAYMFAVAAEAARLAGCAPGLHAEIDSAAAHLDARREVISERSLEIAERIGEATPIVYGSDLTDPIAYRWKCQVNENALRQCFKSSLPEADHNEIAGWGGGGGFAAVMLLDSDQHPRERERFELTGEIISATEGSPAVIISESEGETRTARMFEAVMLGDLVSLQLAAIAGIDPTPVEAIDELKARLGRQ